SNIRPQRRDDIVKEFRKAIDEFFGASFRGLLGNLILRTVQELGSMFGQKLVESHRRQERRMENAVGLRRRYDRGPMGRRSNCRVKSRPKILVRAFEGDETPSSIRERPYNSCA